MARVFVSHSSADATAAGRLHGWLVDDGHDVFLDHHPHDGIEAGEQWQDRLHERLRWADAVVCVVTSAYVASTWCTAEISIAQVRGSRILPVRAEAGVIHPMLTAVQYVDLADDEPAVRTGLNVPLRRLDAGGGAGWPDDRSPFPGLRPFDTELHQAFFGRARDVERLAAVLRSPSERAERAALLVVGPSGCGKSSLVRAGLLPVLAQEPGWLTLPAILPGPEPVAALVRELTALARELGEDWPTAEVRRRLDDGGLAELVDDLLLAAPGPRRTSLLVVVDQFEELLTQAAPEQRARFAAVLGPALGGPVRIVGTLRPEFLEELLLCPELADLPKRVHALEPLGREALRTVVEGPAGLAGIHVDDELVGRLVDETDSGEALPLLAYLLARLAEGVGRGGRVSTDRYEQLGGVRGTLASQADEALAEATGATGRGPDQVVTELLRLVTVDEQGRPTRWRVRRDELSADARTELDRFVERRLLTTDRENDHVVLGVAHEAFLSAWPVLADAIADASTALRARRHIEQAAAAWDDGGRSAERLWEGGQLAAALSDVGARGPAADRVRLGPREREFLRLSVRRDARRRGRRTAVLSVLLVVAVLAAAGALVARQRATVAQQAAEDGQRLVTSRLLTARAESVVTSDSPTALRLAEAAERIHPGPETRAVLARLLLDARYSALLDGHTGPVEAVAFTPDGRTMATGGGDDAVLLWDAADPTRPRRVGGPLTGHTDEVAAVTFTPDGNLLASASRDGRVLLWDVHDPANPHRLGELGAENPEPMDEVAFAADGHTLVTVDVGSSVVLWDVRDPAHPGRLGAASLGPEVAAEAISPDGRTVVAATGDALTTWDLTDPQRPRELGGASTAEESSVAGLAFTADGRTLATTGEEGTVLLWDLGDRARPRRLGDPLTGHTDVVAAVAFAPDGRTLATAGVDRTVLLWDVADPARPRRIGNPLTGHTGTVNAVAFSADGRTVVTAGADGAVVVWPVSDPEQPRRVGELRSPADDTVNALAFAPDGRTVAVAGEDGRVVLSDLADPGRPRRLGELPVSDTDAVHAVAFAPGGRTLAAGTFDGAVTLWDVHDPAAPTRLGAPLQGHTGWVSALAFAPDGRTLATGSADHTVLLWEVRDPARARQLGSALPGPAGIVCGLAFTPDGHTLVSASGDDRAVFLWDIGAPARPRRLGDLRAGQDGWLTGASLHPDGRTLATTNADGTTLIWDVADPAAPRGVGDPLRGPVDTVWGSAFAPHGQVLATADSDGTVFLWDVAATPARRLVPPLSGDTGLATGVAFSPDGRLLAVSRSDATVALWDVGGADALQADPLARACAVTGRGLDRDEWDRAVPDLAYVDSCAG